MKDSLKCVVADDEPLALDLLSALVGRHEGIEIVAACSDGNEALTAIRSLEPDMAFLDIEMPGLSGFDVVRRLQPEAMPAIVFATAFNQYAIEAFDVHAVDYVLKPLSPERLALAVERVRQRIASRAYRDPDSKAAIMSAIGHLSPDDGRATGDAEENREAGSLPKRLLVRDSGKTHVIDQADIDWVDAAGDYMCIHVGSETHVARTTMKKLLEQLDEQLFARIHRSTLVNVNRVQRIENIGKGDCILHLSREITLKVSRNYRDRLMRLLT